MKFYSVICFVWLIVVETYGDLNSYNSCLSQVRSQRDEKGAVSFQETALMSKNRCEQLTRNDCLFYHEATEKCSCVCQELITSNKDRMGNAPNNQGNPPNNNNPPNEGGPACFHGDDVIETDHGSMTIAQLAVRGLDNVRALTRNVDTGSLEMSPVIYWTHANPSIDAQYIDFETESGHKLSITGLHLIYDTDCRGNKRTVLAKRVDVGRCLYVANGEGQTVESPVVSKTVGVKRGVYAPVTSAGNLLVNGITASCYTSGENERLLGMIFGVLVKARQVLAAVLPTSVLNAVFGDPFSSSSFDTPTFVYSFIDLTKIFVRLN